MNEIYSKLLWKFKITSSNDIDEFITEESWISHSFCGTHATM